jgi:class 3 adenylate cyclase
MSEATDPSKRPLVLVVDDTPQNLSLMRDLLEAHYTVKLAPTGARALEIAFATPPDLILLDIMMPGMDGYEVCRTLKANPASKDIPVIFVTAMAEIEDEEIGLSLGAVDFLTKPISPPIVLARVRSQLAFKVLHDEVRDWGKQLEQRVSEQVAQLDRLGRLKGFFSPALADSIVNGGGEDLLKTHRREVVVVFLDLRGFTNFTDSSEPEEVMSVLDEYHRAMGPLILAHDGTLERFAGDGLMIFFNDPITLDNPTANAVKMSLEMQQQFVALRTSWKKRGYDLDLGIGIARGYATLGAVGFEGRWDYACIGSVTNLAARLCSEAKGGQILTNQKTLGRIEDSLVAEPLGELALKGIAAPVPVFNVTGFKPLD